MFFDYTAILVFTIFLVLGGIIVFTLKDRLKKRKKQDNRFSSPKFASQRLGDDFQPIKPLKQQDIQVGEKEIDRISAFPLELDSKIDLVIYLTSEEKIPIEAVRKELINEFGDVQLSMKWFFFDDSANKWQRLLVDQAGLAKRFIASLQLCHRGGCVRDSDYVQFTEGVKRIAKTFKMEVSPIEQQMTVLKKAQELDNFSKDVDLQVAVRVRSLGGGIPGTKVKSLAEANGLELLPTGFYVLKDENGRLLFSMGSAGGEKFLADDMKYINFNNGIVLTCDIALISSLGALDKMILFAEKLAKNVDGELIDDYGNPITLEIVKSWKKQIEKVHSQMHQFGIPPGSQIARRLFDWMR